MVAGIIVVPIMITVVFCKTDSKKWGDEHFMERYSTLIDGTIVMDSTMIKKRGGVGQSELFLIPMSFILRRLVFVLSLVLDSTLSG